MRYEIKPGRGRKTINMTDNICYSHVTDLEGKPLDLYLSLCAQDGNSEMRLAAGRDDESDTTPKPCIVWVPGGGWRGSDKNLMVPEMQFLVERGFVLASIYYRSSAQGHWPDQIVDVKTAIRFLRAHAEQYHIDPDRIGIIGRSAGGHLTSMAAMNLDDHESAEWAGYSSKVQAACDLFGPADLSTLLKRTRELVNAGGYRWDRIEDTHEGALLGGPYDDKSMDERAATATSLNYINQGMCPMCILHGDADLLVPYTISESFYEKLVSEGFGDKVDLYILQGAGHGTREFFQDETKQVIADFFAEKLCAE